MKKLIFFALLSFYFISLKAQIKFEPGYIIRDDNSKVECLIKNEDWKNNPDRFKYKLSNTGNVETGNLTTIREFGDNKKTFRYVKGEVKIEPNATNTETLGRKKEPTFKTETLFLNTLIKGEISLFRYVNGSTNYYYIRNKDQIGFTPLVYKKYLLAQTNRDAIAENNDYKRELSEALNCNSIKYNDLSRLDYHKSDLINLFEKYYNCKGEEYTTYKKSNLKGDFKVTLVAGAGVSSFKFKTLTGSENSLDNTISFTAGAELEYVFQFNRRKWSTFIESTYNTLSTRKEITVSQSELIYYTKRKINLDYSFLRNTFGVRYRIFLSDQAILFLNGAFVFNNTLGDSKVEITQASNFNSYGYEREINTVWNASFGLGLMFNDLRAEIRYNTPTDLIYKYDNSLFHRSITLTIGYTIF